MLKPARRKTDYVWVRPNSQMLWFSRAVPKDCQLLEGGKRVIQFSLGTPNLGQAKALARQHAAEQDKRWGIVTTEPKNDPIAIAVRVGFDAMSERLEAGRKNWPVDDEGYAAKLVERQADIVRLTRRLHDGDFTLWETAADRAIAKHGLPIAKGSSAYLDFIEALAEASLDATATFTRRIAGELEASPRSELVKDTKKREAAKVKPGETILALFEKWAGEMLAKGEKRQDTVNQDRKVIEQFSDFVGRDRSIRSITPIEVAAYREALRDLPPKWASHAKLKGLSMREAAVKARELDLAQTAFTTINKHLSTISPLFKWLGMSELRGCMCLVQHTLRGVIFEAWGFLIISER